MHIVLAPRTETEDPHLDRTCKENSVGKIQINRTRNPNRKTNIVVRFLERICNGEIKNEVVRNEMKGTREEGTDQVVKSLRNWAMAKARKAEMRGRLNGGDQYDVV